MRTAASVAAASTLVATTLEATRLATISTSGIIPTTTVAAYAKIK